MLELRSRGFYSAATRALFQRGAKFLSGGRLQCLPLFSPIVTLGLVGEICVWGGDAPLAPRSCGPGLLYSSLCLWSSSFGHWCWYAFGSEVWPKKQQILLQTGLRNESYSLAARQPKLCCSFTKGIQIWFWSMNDSKLKLSEEARLLGVTLDSKLTWKPHITRITRKATTALMQCR